MTKKKNSAVDALRKWAANPKAQWSEDLEDSPQEVFRGLIKLIGTDLPEWKYFDCGSAELEPTPDALYRLLYLCRPKAVDFSDMYKTCLFAFTSLDGHFLVAVHLYKYEVALYFACPRDCIGGRGSGVISGLPGADNGWTCTAPEGREFFDLVAAMARRPLDVYPGNRFTV